MDCFAALAMTSKHTFTTPPRDAPEPLMNLPPKEGVGNAGCPLHPRPRVHLVRGNRNIFRKIRNKARHLTFERWWRDEAAEFSLDQLGECNRGAVPQMGADD